MVLVKNITSRPIMVEGKRLAPGKSVEAVKNAALEYKVNNGFLEIVQVKSVEKTEKKETVAKKATSTEEVKE